MSALDKTGLDAARAKAESLLGDLTGALRASYIEVAEAHTLAYLSSTSAGVTEEQAPSVKQLERLKITATCDWRDEIGHHSYIRVEPAPDGEYVLYSALEASRVAPVSQKEAAPVVAAKVKPLDLSALLRDAFLAGRGLKDGDRLSDDDHTAWCAYDPERMNAYNRICAALYASPAPAGVTAIKALEWKAPSKATNGCWTAESPFGTYSVVNEGGWFACREETPRDFYFEWFGEDMSRDTLYTAQSAAQADYEARVRSALHPSPTPVSAPVGVVELHIVFQDDDGAANLRFVEVETLDRKSVCAGTWLKRDDGYDVLALSVHPSDIKTVEAK
nr:hypothetical protein RAR13_11615 [Aminobacter aminovorans]